MWCLWKCSCTCRLLVLWSSWSVLNRLHTLMLFRSFAAFWLVIITETFTLVMLGCHIIHTQSSVSSFMMTITHIKPPRASFLNGLSLWFFRPFISESSLSKSSNFGSPWNILLILSQGHNPYTLHQDALWSSGLVLWKSCLRITLCSAVAFPAARLGKGERLIQASNGSTILFLEALVSKNKQTRKAKRKYYDSYHNLTLTRSWDRIILIFVIWVLVRRHLYIKTEFWYIMLKKMSHSC